MEVMMNTHEEIEIEIEIAEESSVAQDLKTDRVKTNDYTWYSGD